jgi:hypothetical protein
VEIIGIKTKQGIFVSIFYPADPYRKYQNLNGYIINGDIPKPTFHKDWSIVESVPQKVEQKKSQPNINHRYELKDKSMESKKTPLVLQRGDVAYYEDYSWVWKDEFSMFRSLYKEVSDKQPSLIVDVDFEYVQIMECDELMRPVDFDQEVQRTQWESDGMRKIDENDIVYQLIDKIIFPEIALPSKKCALSIKKSYQVIREYVKKNIDGRYAEVTSDYDFCFTVRRKIALSEPEKYTVDVNFDLFSKRKRKPKYETRYRKNRYVECFEMAPKPYQRYTVLKHGFRGENQQDLDANIKRYCESLMEFINKPLVECKHCNGNGVILDNVKFDPNEGKCIKQ